MKRGEILRMGCLKEFVIIMGGEVRN